SHLGSFSNSRCCIKQELLRIIVQNYKIDNLVSIQQNNQNLIDRLELIKPWQTSGSLAVYDSFESEELLQFKKMFCHELEDTITGSKSLPGEILMSRLIYLTMYLNV